MNSHLLDTKNIVVHPEFPYPKEGVVICDAKVAKLFASEFSAIQLPTLKFQAHESNKSLSSVQKVYEFLSKHNVHKKAIVHVFGGGVTMDMAAFAVSTFKRGCQLYLYPTTLLGMIDASIGGKTGINLNGIKNQIGSFYPAHKIILCEKFLSTLEEEHFRQGMAEILKLFLVDSSLNIKSPFNPKTYTMDGILTCAKRKMEICAKDPFDTGIRRHLNFGHTFAHALESLSNYTVKHGDAVVWGMMMANDTAKDRKLISNKDYSKIDDLITDYPMPQPVLNFIDSHPFSQYFKYLAHDKKSDDHIRLILPNGFRSVKEVEIGDI